MADEFGTKGPLWVHTSAGLLKRQPCQTKGCTDLGNPCWLPGNYGEPDEWHCGEHMHRAGFCVGCGTFWAGVEMFDFGPGWCSNCASEFEEPEYEEDLDFGFYFDEVPQ